MKKRIVNAGVLALAMAAFFGCSSNDDSNYVDPNADLFSVVLTDVTTDVITATYNDLNEKAIVLKSAINTLAATPNDANLQAVKTAWSATRQPWEQSEGFLYGPVDTNGIDPAMDTWPVDVSAMNAILNSSQAITASLIAANNEARGFHLIEFLVWGENSTKTAAQLNARELQYLQAAATDLQNNTQTLYDGWKTSGGNFGANFINAGAGSNLYPSKKAALEEIIEGLITIADEVGNGKIEDPLNSGGSTPNAELEESRFSNNSKLDFANNMRSIQNIYLGDYNGINGNGLTNIIAAGNATLDAQVKTKINEAIAAIENIPGTFSSAIYTNRAAVSAAQAKVGELQLLLESTVKPYVAGL